MNYTDLLEEIINGSIVSDKDGNCFKLNGSIDRTEGQYIFDLIKNDPQITRTLEIGFGYGISTLFICAALQGRNNARHLIIDPFQFSDYSGIGIYNLERVDCNFFELITEPSEYALPKLSQLNSEKFDLIFIDGWHTFDHVMIDLYYSNKLLKIGGYVVLDDCRYHSVAKAISYLSTLPSYKKHSETTINNLKFSAKTSRLLIRAIPEIVKKNLFPFKMHQLLNRHQNSSMITFKKIAQDERNWRWYEEF
jgi:predicted O-methyltransferase YrrM